MFYNFTTEDFHITWDGKPYTFKAGEVYEKLAIANDGISNVQLTDTVCSVFARHLANKVLDTPEANKNFTFDGAGNPISNDIAQMRISNINNVEALMQRATTPPIIDVPLPTIVEEIVSSKKKKAVKVEKEEVAEPVEEIEEKPLAFPKKKKLKVEDTEVVAEG